MDRQAASRRWGAGALLALAVLLVVPAAMGRAAATVRLSCKAVGNTCTVDIPITAADEGAHVVITTPRKNTGATIADNNHTPFTAMYNADETPSGLTFDLKGVASVKPGTVLVIVFKLVPAGSAPAGKASPSGSSSIKLSGPTSNKLGSSFTYKVAATAGAAAILEAFEETGNACADSAASYPRSTARVHQAVPAGSFTVDFHLTAEPAGTFAFCVYLVDPATNATEARAFAHWTNHA